MREFIRQKGLGQVSAKLAPKSVWSAKKRPVGAMEKWIPSGKRPKVGVIRVNATVRWMDGGHRKEGKVTRVGLLFKRL